jgi:hypothetical protein
MAAAGPIGACAKGGEGPLTSCFGGHRESDRKGVLIIINHH